MEDIIIIIAATWMTLAFAVGWDLIAINHGERIAQDRRQLERKRLEGDGE